MNREEITSITMHKEEFCLTLIVPLHSKNPERQKDPLILKRVIQSAADLLRSENTLSKQETNKLIDKLYNFENTFDFVHCKEGVGVYLTPTFFKVISFPFEVNQRIEFDNSFSSYELYYYLFTPFKYQVLSIQHDDVRLFNAEASELKEFYNDDFPAYYEEAYEYAHADSITAHGSTVSKQFEREKTMLDSLRRFDFFKMVDGNLSEVLHEGKPLLITGASRELGAYLEVTKHMHKVYGKIIGNLLFDGVWSFGIACWQEMQYQTTKKNDILIGELYELYGKHLLTFGLENVWDTAFLGKGRILFIDKALRKSAFLSSDGSQLKLRKPIENNGYVLLKDAIGKLMELVLAKGGELVFVEPGKLDDFNGVALTHRYV